MGSIIEANNIDKVFRSGNEDFYALKDVSVKIGEGRLVILKGRSGSGKTTLLNILSSLDMPTRGKVDFDGKDIVHMNDKEKGFLRSRQTGFVFQSVALIPIMNSYENVEFALRLAGWKKHREERVKEVLELVGMSARINHMPGQMSGGEQQRIAIARAIAHKPKVLFADEPTAALDTANGHKIMGLFRELIEKEGITVVMTTHDPGLMELGDDVYELLDGRVINDFSNDLEDKESDKNE